MRSLPGTYALFFKSKQKNRISVGKLGSLNLQPGYYIYIGSAFGPGGLKSRVGHHNKISSRHHWHIDYLGEYLSPAEVWYTYDTIHREHQWSQALAHARGVSTPLSGFGSSDCRCKSHLYFFSARPSRNYFRRKIHTVVNDHARIFIEKLVDDN